MYERLISIGTYHLFIFNHTSTTEIYTLSLHDALPIWLGHVTAAPLVELGNAPVAGFDLRAKPVLAQRATSPCTPVAVALDYRTPPPAALDLVPVDAWLTARVTLLALLRLAHPNPLPATRPAGT